MSLICTGCEAVRPKHARWYYINSNAQPPIVYCPPCAETKAPDAVARRAAMREETSKRRRGRRA